MRYKEGNAVRWGAEIGFRNMNEVIVNHLKLGCSGVGSRKMGLDEVGKLVSEVQKRGLEIWRGTAGDQRLGVQRSSRVEVQK